ncbi:hypothetical protein JCM17846_23250 [Iodidimonas nitroreducens]|uniref:SCO family protein n=1 Tax=Iodidimonas nitroreducens TaxID=1236968 RepID=I4DD91_9PROT|nr:SCO family protein [Iodidimonas nitroreducens]BAM15881.1 hypothetical protein [Iodidimonas nitroreducens]GAK33401.1 SCO1/SenC family protein [alpha proteobacterium Q-1]GER04643.1 hypothetical protein JCM17846_23250 [Iodidimonas nitroreducens]
MEQTPAKTLSKIMALGCMALGFTAMSVPARAQADHSTMDHSQHGQNEHVMGHGEQKFHMYNGPTKPGRNYKASIGAYDVSSVQLVDQHGKAHDLAQILAQPGPVALQFIFTSCATVCPVLSASFAQSIAPMTDLDPETRLISISIDPEYDTPERLLSYAKRYNAPENWIFLTGSLAEVRLAIKAFDALYESGNKMYHRPYTYLRAEPGKDWVRLDGLLSKAALMNEFESVLQHKAAAHQ